MPLLRREADHFPEDVFRLPLTDFPWGVAHVKSRTEKALARYLGTVPIPFYLPLGERRTRRSGRTFVSYLPFFPGYVFLRGSATSRAQALRSNLVVRLLEVTDQPLLDQELCQLRALQEAGAPLTPCPYLGPGDAVRVQEGPFQGYLGVVVRKKGSRRLVVSVSMLRRSVAVELDRESLAPGLAAPRRTGGERRAPSTGLVR
jgi:transcription antitermination factor NusG